MVAVPWFHSAYAACQRGSGSWAGTRRRRLPQAACALSAPHLLASVTSLPAAAAAALLPLQLIVHLGVPADDPCAPDWGTIAVYSCSASCASGVTAGASPPEESAYLEEFVWVQGPV